MPTLSRKDRNPFAGDQVVRAVRTFAHQDGVIHIGEEFRGGDPVVEANWTAFVPGDTLDQELENPFDVLPPPPEHAPPVQVQGTSIPIHRQVRCIVDATVPVQWAPDSPGAKSGTPPPFIRSTLRAGQICDVLSDVVRKNPNWFRWEARDVTLADIERMERHERHNS
jgi:hypothetical protein